MNSEISKTSDHYRLLLNLSDKINLKRSDKYTVLSNLSISYTYKSRKNHRKTINLQYQLQRGILYLNYSIDYILYQKHEAVTDHSPVIVYVDEIKNRITFKIKTGYYLTLSTSETMKLLKSTKNNIIKDENGKRVPHLVLVNCNIVDNESGYHHCTTSFN